MIYLVNILQLIRVALRIFRVPIAWFLLIVAVILLFFVIIRFWNDKIIRFLCRKKSIDEIVFAEDEVVKSMGPLKRTLLPGAVLFVPPGTAAWLATPPSGNPIPYEEGQHVIQFHTRAAHPRYIDIKRRTNDFTVENASTRDGFQVTFTGRVSWIVADVGGAASFREPVQELRMEVSKAVRSIVSRHDHNELIPAPGYDLFNESDLIGEICTELEGKAIFNVIRLHSVVLENRVGDSEWVGLVKESKFQEFNGRMNGRNLEIRLESAENEKAIARLESEIQEEQARYERLSQKEADEKEEEREKVKQKIDRDSMFMDARKDALPSVLNSYTNLLAQPHGRTSSNDYDVRMLSDAVRFIIQGMGDFKPYVMPGEYEDVTHLPKDAKSELFDQLSKAADLDGFTTHNLRETSDGRWRLEIWINACRVIIWYNLGGSAPVITDIIVVNSIDRIFKIKDVASYKFLKLKEVIRKLIEKYDPK